MTSPRSTVNARAVHNLEEPARIALQVDYIEIHRHPEVSLQQARQGGSLLREALGHP